MFISSMAAISSTSWLTLWIFMELNSISFCGSMFKETKNKKKESMSSMMYLVIQMTSSIILIVSSMLSNSYIILQIMCILSLFMKVGMWPTHLWYLKTLETMSMKKKSMKIIMTWQKIIPMIIIMNFPLKIMLILFSLINMISPLTLLKKSTNLKSTLILSSMNNSSWFLLSLFSSLLSFFMFFTFYSLSIFITLSFFKTVKTKMCMIPSKMWEAMLILANMGSIPPTVMFLVKAVVLYTLILVMNSKETAVLMTLMACVFTYFYMWGVLNLLTKMNNKTQLLKEKQSIHSQLVIILSSLTILLLMLG
uniref:NADH-ubiquinone oxidoreductase chain 2 n=1 Tax=Trouessartia rubecula TaxID=474308 RepID=A0A451G5Q4_9ACAR|nr:NADH dehydrogenase subunit 2 [Trouessartia rubecula]QAB47275.1 NADH dehydrogenase subunit 2 [Trouessartia rubecula]